MSKILISVARLIFYTLKPCSTDSPFTAVVVVVVVVVLNVDCHLLNSKVVVVKTKCIIVFAVVLRILKKKMY